MHLESSNVLIKGYFVVGQNEARQLPNTVGRSGAPRADSASGRFDTEVTMGTEG